MPTKTKPPCQHCPFRAKYHGERDYLREGRRAGIVESVLKGAMFPCHETVTHHDGDDGEVYADESKAEGCAGLDIVMLRAGASGQMMRIRERLGMLDPEVLLHKSRNMQMWDYDEIMAPPEVGCDGADYCSVVGANCEAPAGFMMGGGVVHGVEFTDSICETCGDFVCPGCMDDEEHQCFTAEMDDPFPFKPVKAWGPKSPIRPTGNYAQPSLPLHPPVGRASRS
jgi:hypothetical protein